jgi:pyrroloquinoline quinone biosynthesis protein E
LTKASQELDTKTWINVFNEAADLGVAHVHLSGGEPLVRPDLAELTNAAHLAGLYTNLITSAVGLSDQRLTELRSAGLDHVQISFQGIDAATADVVAHFKGATKAKREAAKLVVEEGLALTINAVIHRNNINDLPAIIDMAEELGAGRLEVAHVQYHGWAVPNRANLIPTREQFLAADKIVVDARTRLEGNLVIDYVIPDYYAERPKACMGGWGRQFLVVNPLGQVLPCHAAPSIPGLVFENVRDRPLAAIWTDSPAFEAYRGTAWMAEPCRTCDRREIDWGGCRCQAMALVGNAGATDPACARSPDHAAMVSLASEEATREADDFVYRQIGGLKPA